MHVLLVVLEMLNTDDTYFPLFRKTKVRYNRRNECLLYAVDQALCLYFAYNFPFDLHNCLISSN